MSKHKDWSLEQLLDNKLGNLDNQNRKDFEMKVRFFELSEIIRSTRLEAGLTQQELAQKLGTQKSYISKIENGNCDIKYSTMLKIFEGVFNKSLNIIIE